MILHAGAAGDAAVAAALDANFAELLAWYASFPGGQAIRGADLWTCQCRVPFRPVNAVVHAYLDPAVARDLIAETIALMSADGMPWRWLVGPTSRPTDLDARLLTAGLTLVSDNPGMALDISRPIEPFPVRAEGLTIRRLANEADLDAWLGANRRALAMDDSAASAWRTVHARAGFTGDLPLRNQLAVLDGEVVATAALFEGAGVAGIYNVCTVPEARGLGIGRAVTAAVIEDARSVGLRTAVLGASAMGEPVYRGMGFREVSRLRSYAVVQPATSQSA